LTSTADEEFTGAYRHTIEGCYACHKASDKPYLRPRIPEPPESRIINVDPRRHVATGLR